MHLVEYGLLKILESTIDHFEVGKFKEFDLGPPYNATIDINIALCY